MSDNSIYSENELLLRIASGDEFAFRQIFEDYHPRLYSYLLRLTGNTEQAEDIVHDVFVKIWTRRSQLHEITNLNAYLFRMAQHMGYDGFRRMAKETLVLTDFANKPVQAINDPEELVIHKEIASFIQETLTTLTPQQRQVFMLSRGQGLKQDEIAQQLGISVLTVKRHLTDALNVMRRKISLRYPAYWPFIAVVFHLAK